MRSLLKGYNNFWGVVKKWDRHDHYQWPKRNKKGHPSSNKFNQEYLGSYSPSDNVISLFQSANQFTFMHESAHMYLSTLSQLAANGSKEAQAELDTILSGAKYSPEAMADYAGTKLEADFKEIEKKIKGGHPPYQIFKPGFKRGLNPGKLPFEYFNDLRREGFGVENEAENLSKGNARIFMDTPDALINQNAFNGAVKDFISKIYGKHKSIANRGLFGLKWYIKFFDKIGEV